MTKIADPGLSKEGEKNFLWAKAHMGALTTLTEKYVKAKALRGVRVGVCLHVTKETSVLIDALLNAGADVKLSGANPLSTQDDIAAYLSTRTDVWAWRGQSGKEYAWCINQILGTKPEQLVDDGEIGRVYYYDSTRVNLGLFQHDVNVVWDLAPHDISIILHILGEFPSTVNCRGSAHITPGIEDVTTM